MNEPISVDVIIPCYKQFDQISSLISSLADQKDIFINKIVCPLTLSRSENDQRIKDFFEANKVAYFELEPKDFSHSLTREKAIKEYCESNIVVLLSQDIKFADEHSIFNLVKPVQDGECVYAYGRQICPKKSLEKYIREKNYPLTSKVTSKDDIGKLQIMAFFASDAFSALDRNIFIKIGGYQNFDIMMNEDMLYSYFVLQNGYKKKYCSDATIIHYHNLKLKQLYARYYDTGIFYQKVTLFNNYKSTESGAKLAMYTLGQCLKHFDIKSTFRWLPDMAARYLGMKKGKRAKLMKEGK